MDKTEIIFIVIAFVIMCLFIGILVSGVIAGVSKTCMNDAQCVPAQCCHPESCINSIYKESCDGIRCTMSCLGPIDCGHGHCGCVDGKCKVIPGPS